MKALVTGGAGFIGSHLVERLIRKGHEVSIIDNLSTGDLVNLPEEFDNIHLFPIQAEVRKGSSWVLDELVQEADVVFHLAASVGVKSIWDDPVGCIRNNIDSTLSVLNNCLNWDKRLLITSTSEVYGRSLHQFQSEYHSPKFGPPDEARWSYAASKYIDEIIALSYFKKYGLKVTVVRLFNVIGKRQTGNYGMVVPRFIEKAKKNEPLEVYGDGKQVRTFVDVADVVWALDHLTQREDSIGKLYNVGGVCTTSIHDLAKKVIELTNSKSGIRFVPYNEAYGEGFTDMMMRVPDIRRINWLIGFMPNGNLGDILRKIIND